MTNTLDRILTDLSAHFGKTADPITVGTGQMTTPKPMAQLNSAAPGSRMTMPKPVKPGLAAGVNNKRNRGGGGTSRMMRGMFGVNMLSNAVNTFSQNLGNAAGQVVSPVM